MREEVVHFLVVRGRTPAEQQLGDALGAVLHRHVEQRVAVRVGVVDRQVPVHLYKPSAHQAWRHHKIQHVGLRPTFTLRIGAL